MFLSIVVFCYNEVGNITAVLQKAHDFLEANYPQFELLIVNDGSNDGSAELINSFWTNHSKNVRVIHHPINLGIGAALRSGYAEASGEYVCAIPGDDQFDISTLKQLKPFGDAAFYSFYRTEKRYGWYRSFLTWFNRSFNSLFLGVQLRDVNWIKVYRKSQLKLVNPQLSSSLIESEICAKLFKIQARPIELPSEYLERKTGNPKGGSLKTLSKAALQTWKLIRLVRKFKPSTSN